MTARFAVDGPLKVLGRLPDSSNNALLCSVTDAGQRVVYKPVAGEQPLWDFPHGTLTRRERAASALDSVLGWGMIPQTEWLDDGPAGPGILQAWVDGRIDLGVFGRDAAPEGWVVIAEAQTQDGPVDVAHRDDEATQRLIVFDTIANNADRKGGHLLRNDEGLFGIDHGVTFHVEPKLRTVLWGLAGSPVPPQILEEVEACVLGLADALGPWLSAAEVGATTQRARALLNEGVFPSPSGQWPALPWPLI